MTTDLTPIWTNVVISFFLAFQYAIHSMMVQSKQRRLDFMDQLLANKFDEWSSDPVSDKSKAVSDLIAWRDHIKEELDWPLDFRSMLLVVSGLLLPTLKTIIDLVTT